MKIPQLTPWIATFMILALVNPSLAITKEELKARFEKRYPQLLQYKTQGKIGENAQGFVEFVDPKYKQDQAISKTVDDENSDRRELYKLIAADEKTTADLVAQRTAKRNYEQAKNGEYLKQSDGSWKKKS